MTHHGLKAAVGASGSAQGCGRRRSLLGPSQREALFGSFPQSSFCHVKRDVLCSCRRGCLQTELQWQWDGDKSRAGRKDGAGGTEPEHQTLPHVQEARPSSRNTHVSALPLHFSTRCMAGTVAGNAAELPAAPAEPRWAQHSAPCPAAHLGHAVLHSPSSCNTCFPSGCFVYLDQK